MSGRRMKLPRGRAARAQKAGRRRRLLMQAAIISLNAYSLPQPRLWLKSDGAEALYYQHAERPEHASLNGPTYTATILPSSCGTTMYRLLHTRNLITPVGSARCRISKYQLGKRNAPMKMLQVYRADWPPRQNANAAVSALSITSGDASEGVAAAATMHDDDALTMLPF